jgi:hypothetical protein
VKGQGLEPLGTLDPLEHPVMVDTLRGLVREAQVSSQDASTKLAPLEGDSPQARGEPVEAAPQLRVGGERVALGGGDLQREVDPEFLAGRTRQTNFRGDLIDRDPKSLVREVLGALLPFVIRGGQRVRVHLCLSFALGLAGARLIRTDL